MDSGVFPRFPDPVLVQHKCTKEDFELSIHNKDTIASKQEFTKLFKNHEETLRKLSGEAKLAGLCDYYDEQSQLYFIHQTVGKLTLEGLMDKIFPQTCDESFAKRTIIDVCTIVESLHHRGIMHRRIEAEVVGMKISTDEEENHPLYQFKVC